MLPAPLPATRWFCSERRKSLRGAILSIHQPSYLSNMDRWSLKPHYIFTHLPYTASASDKAVCFPLYWSVYVCTSLCKQNSTTMDTCNLHTCLHRQTPPKQAAAIPIAPCIPNLIPPTALLSASILRKRIDHQHFNRADAARISHLKSSVSRHATLRDLKLLTWLRFRRRLHPVLEKKH